MLISNALPAQLVGLLSARAAGTAKSRQTSPTSPVIRRREAGAGRDSDRQLAFIAGGITRQLNDAIELGGRIELFMVPDCFRFSAGSRMALAAARCLNCLFEKACR
jgi:hypothetical protein